MVTRTNVVIEEAVQRRLRDDKDDAALVVEHGHALHAGLEHRGRAREARTAVHGAERVSSREVCACA